jgi:aryl-phospho-beta-D-glucosidase BglC (GH1 family)
MKSYLLLLLLTSGILNIPPVIAQDPAETGYHAWWNEGYRFPPEKDPTTRKMPLIRVEGNRFVNAKGDTLLIRGLAISDPDKVEKQGHWNKQHFKKVKEMGATICRIPVHPVAWRERTPEGYLELLDQAVRWCTELDLYIIIDWHSIGNLGMELFQNPMYNTTKKETYEFWRTISMHFSGHNTVAFYEIFNEPTLYRGQLGSMTWTEWKQINENIIKLIRSFDKETIPLVAGFDWAYDLTHIRYDPVEAEGIGYVTHPYPFKRSRPWEAKWEENFGFAADLYPVMATELSFWLREEDSIDDDHYGYHIIPYLESRNISWVCWVFDPEWHPQMLKSWDTYELTGVGAFFKEALNGKVQH